MSKVEYFLDLPYHRVDTELSELNYPVSTNSNQSETSRLKQLKLMLVQHNFFLAWFIGSVKNSKLEPGYKSELSLTWAWN